MQYHRSDEFAELRNAPHQRVSSYCELPSLTRNRCWWVEPYPDASREPPKTGASEMRTELENFHKGIISLLDKHLKDRIFAKEKIHEYNIYYGYFDGIYQTFILSLHYNRLTLKQIINPFHVSRTLDDHRQSNNIALCEIFNLSDLLRSWFDSLQSNIRTYRSINYATNSKFSNEYEEQHGRELRECSEVLYDKIWNEIDVLLGLKEVDKTKSSTSRINLFADFRALILPDNPKQIKNPPSLHPILQFKQEEASIKDPHLVINRYWPFIKAMEQKQYGEKRSLDKDIIVSLINDRSSMYISSLGQTGNDVEPGTEADKLEPIRYLVLSKISARRQLGRLSDRIDRLGTYRLLALRNFKEIRRKGDMIENTEALIREYRERSTEVDKTVESEKSGNEPVTVFDDQFYEIERLINNIDQNVHGGISHRVFASRHYVRSYWNLAKGLRSDRVEGFQPYDEFIHRQLTQHYDFIDNFGKKVDALQTSFGNLIQQQQVKGLANFSRKIKNAQQELVSLQKAAHAIEFIAITYYGGSIINYMIDDTIAEEIIGLINTNILMGYELDKKILGFAIAVLTWGIIRMFRKSNH